MGKEKLLKDDEILEALKVCLDNPCIRASEVAEVLGVNSRYVKDRLLELTEENLVSGKYRGNSWCFTLKQ
jgi:predicted ArsR family transcriptional regulator